MVTLERQVTHQRLAKINKIEYLIDIRGDLVAIILALNSNNPSTIPLKFLCNFLFKKNKKRPGSRIPDNTYCQTHLFYSKGISTVSKVISYYLPWNLCISGFNKGVLYNAESTYLARKVFAQITSQFFFKWAIPGLFFFIFVFSIHS